MVAAWPTWRLYLAAVGRGHRGADAARPAELAVAAVPPGLSAAAVPAAPTAGVRVVCVCAVYPGAACALGLGGLLITRLLIKVRGTKAEYKRPFSPETPEHGPRHIHEEKQQ